MQAALVDETLRDDDDDQQEAETGDRRGVRTSPGVDNWTREWVQRNQGVRGRQGVAERKGSHGGERWSGGWNGRGNDRGRRFLSGGRSKGGTDVDGGRWDYRPLRRLYRYVASCCFMCRGDRCRYSVDRQRNAGSRR